MQVECRGNCDLEIVEGKTWHAMMALVETLKTTRERRPLLCLRPRLVKHRGKHCGIRRAGLGYEEGGLGADWGVPGGGL